MRRTAGTLLLMTISVLPNVLFAQISGQSPTCGSVSGKTVKDRDNALAFCKGLPKEGVVGVMAMDSLLWIKVSRGIADAMLADRLTTEQVVKNWMAVWKKYSGAVVTVTVEWQDVEIAKGQTSVFSGDLVTIRK